MSQGRSSSLAPGYNIGERRARHKASTRQLISTLMAIIMATIIGLSILRMRHPEVFYDIVMEVDVLGVTESSHAEKQRLSSIALLPISDEKKQYLINHSIYMGAAPQMVLLALGEPRGIQRAINPDSQTEQLIYIYHFDTDSRPTMLAFEDDKLVAAQKAPIDFHYKVIKKNKKQSNALE
jgi:hypothetical protein